MSLIKGKHETEKWTVAVQWLPMSRKIETASLTASANHNYVRMLELSTHFILIGLEHDKRLAKTLQGHYSIENSNLGCCRSKRSSARLNMIEALRLGLQSRLFCSPADWVVSFVAVLTQPDTEDDAISPS